MGLSPSGICRRSTVGERSAEVHQKLTTSFSIKVLKHFLVLLEEHVYDEACVLETAVMLSEISIIAVSKEILSVHHFTVLVISPMRLCFCIF